MAIVVNKEAKREFIALSCKDLLLEFGIKKLTVSQIADAAGIGKGTIYEYFSNKEDIVFEIISIFIVELEKELLCVASDFKISAPQKVVKFMGLLFEERYKKELVLYQEFLSIAISGGTLEMIEFRVQCQNRFETILAKIIDYGIQKGEFSQEASRLIPLFKLFYTGLTIDVLSSKVNAHQEIDAFLVAIAPCILTKKGAV